MPHTSRGGERIGRPVPSCRRGGGLGRRGAALTATATHLGGATATGCPASTFQRGNPNGYHQQPPHRQACGPCHQPTPCGGARSSSADGKSRQLERPTAAPRCRARACAMVIPPNHGVRAGGVDDRTLKARTAGRGLLSLPRRRRSSAVRRMLRGGHHRAHPCPRGRLGRAPSVRPSPPFPSNHHRRA